MRRLTLLACSLVAIALLIGACGKSDEGESGGGEGDRDVVNSVEDVQDAALRIVANGAYTEPDGSFAVSQQLQGTWSGSGFIIDESGLAVTNNHVVTGAASLEVFVGGSDESVNATVLGVSECSDLAVIDLEGDGYKSLGWYEGDVEAGLEVRAAGFPLGDEEYTLVSGIVAKATADGDTNWASIDSVIQHDAATQPGNSGGPLVDAETGHVVGVHYAGGDPGTGTNQYFAISAEEAEPLVEQLAEGDVLSIGVNGVAVSNDEGVAGVWVSSVDTNSPAGEVGLQGGDIIEKIEGLSVGTEGTMKNYCDILQSHGSGDKLSLTVLRFADGTRLTGELNGDELAVAESLGDDVEETTGELPPGTPYSDYVAITDDSGALSVTVPVEWAETDGAPTGDSGEYPQLRAAPDLEAFDTSWVASGMSIFVAEPAVDGDELLDGVFSDIEGCSDDGREDYDDNVYTGRRQYWSCDEGKSTVVGIAAHDPNSTFTMLVIVQLTSEADLEALDQIILTFQYASGG